MLEESSEESEDSELLHLSDLSIQKYDDLDLQTVFSSKSSEELAPLCVTRRFLSSLEALLYSRNYIGSATRDFLRCLVTTLEPEKRTGVPDVFEDISARRYIRKDTRGRLLELLKKWKGVIIAYSEQSVSPLVKRNGELQSSFEKWISHHDLSCTAALSGGKPTLLVTGHMSPADFEKALAQYAPRLEWESYVRYEVQEPMKDDGGSKFGDCYSAMFVHSLSESLPLPTAAFFRGNGRGTIGAIIEFDLVRTLPQSRSVVSCGQYILTAAHVAFGSLNPDYFNREPDDTCVATLNAKCLFAGYMRPRKAIEEETEVVGVDQEGNEVDARVLDYAIVPCLPTLLTASGPEYYSSERSMCNARDLLGLWIEIQLRLKKSVSFEVIKRGVVTGETLGRCIGFDENKLLNVARLGEDIQEYSRPGDSGALVCAILPEETCLVPIGIHIQGSSSGGAALPLWIIFNEYYRKHKIAALGNQFMLRIRFISPSLSGVCDYVPPLTD